MWNILEPTRDLEQVTQHRKGKDSRLPGECRTVTGSNGYSDRLGLKLERRQC